MSLIATRNQPETVDEKCWGYDRRKVDQWLTIELLELDNNNDDKYQKKLNPKMRTCRGTTSHGGAIARAEGVEYQNRQNKYPKVLVGLEKDFRLIYAIALG